MSNWKHNHILDLSTFSIQDYVTVLELANRFKALIKTGSRKLPALQGRLVATLFFEPSTRTRSSFELAAKGLSADIQSFSPSSSSQTKGESPLDTALTYVAMGADILIVRHSATNTPYELANYLTKNNKKVSVLNGGDGLHSHPSQGLLDLFTLAEYFNPKDPNPSNLYQKTITIVGDILHSRVARSNIWALTACGANIILCGPRSLVPKGFKEFIDNPPPGQINDPIEKRGKIEISDSIEVAIKNTDAIMTLRLQKERMKENMISNLNNYYIEYGLNHEKLKWCEKKVPILHPGPVNRGIEISGELIDDKSISLIDKQVANGIPIRMALLYLLSTNKDYKSLKPSEQSP